MILSPYLNPPYRSPIPSTRMNSSSPAQSPKRKRSDDSDNPPEHELNNNAKATNDMQNEQIPEASSPRMGVAEKLKDLNLRPVKGAGLFTKEQSAPRKRLKKTAPPSTSRVVVEIPFRSTKDLSRPLESSDEIGETRDCRVKGTDFSSTSPAQTTDPGRASRTFQITGDSIKVAPRTPSPTPYIDPDLTPLDSPVADPLNRSVSPLPVREDLTPDQAALTWQEDEITGHEIDAAAEDDGEGINGIGFKPTPAIAYARQQKRKQQVNEYKTREAREARQKRLQRRRGAAMEALDEAKRMVRFSGVG